MLPQTSRDARPATSATTQFLDRGEYLARAGDCVACHTAPDGREFAGGRAMATPFGNLYVPEHHARRRDRHRQMERATISIA